ncbi:hypothetical protein [Limosilactobacillus fermentum]|uniref:hypothetical protein n=1 Tax=Limosilactobacillus fermentum TaxID=1613 RepID=UPI0027B8AB1B|nr:hypothetical protein [Limosilactobacillus fermentum]WLW45051.1 hypothetical protein RA155_03045 [Limosilactobacillus fermentum]WLW45102.1 hypothetical protein RA155_03300 [Limosilactobacillus fermentum]
MDSRDMSQNAKLRSDDMEPDPKLDSARDVDQNPKLDYALSNCGQLLTDAKLRPSDMEMDPKLDSSDMATDPKLDSLDFFIKSNYKQSRPL